MGCRLKHSSKNYQLCYSKKKSKQKARKQRILPYFSWYFDSDLPRFLPSCFSKRKKNNIPAILVHDSCVLQSKLTLIEFKRKDKIITSTQNFENFVADEVSFLDTIMPTKLFNFAFSKRIFLSIFISSKQSTSFQSKG